MQGLTLLTSREDLAKFKATFENDDYKVVTGGTAYPCMVFIKKYESVPNSTKVNVHLEYIAYYDIKPLEDEMRYQMFERNIPLEVATKRPVS